VSDVRFTILGIILIFVGFIVLGVFGSGYSILSVEAQEFDDCYEYFEDKEPIPIDCNLVMQGKTVFFILVIVLIASGIVFLIKGVRGSWDQDVKPEDMVGPGKPTGPSSDKPDNKKSK